VPTSLTVRPLIRMLMLVFTLGLLLAQVLEPSTAGAQSRRSSCSRARGAAHPCAAPARRTKSHARPAPKRRPHPKRPAHKPKKTHGKKTALPVPAICEDGSTPLASEGSFACSDGSEPVCADGATPVPSVHGTTLVCPADSEEAGSSDEAGCEEEGNCEATDPSNEENAEPAPEGEELRGALTGSPAQAVSLSSSQLATVS
jgi:hypothetical protein